LMGVHARVADARKHLLVRFRREPHTAAMLVRTRDDRGEYASSRRARWGGCSRGCRPCVERPGACSLDARRRSLNNEAK
jgi:hypothetical protein